MAKVMDLGTLSGPLWVFGGALSNLPALRAFLAQADAAGVASTNILSTGDIVGYGADGAGCVALVQASGFRSIAGNVERQLAANAGDCGCGFEAGSTCDQLSDAWYGQAVRTIGSSARDWMRDLPDVLTFKHFGQRVAVIHGGVDDISRFIWPGSADSVFQGEIDLLQGQVGQVDRVLAGHCGVAFERQVGAVSWVNAGVIGMPPHDGRPETRYVVLDSDGARIERLTYDATAAQQAMQAVGLTQGYDMSVLSGIWPSEDVLPANLRR